MAVYLFKRLIRVVVLLLLISLVVFMLFSVLPTDPARLTCGKACTPAIIEANRHRLGLDMPYIQQYWLFVRGLFVGRTYFAESPSPIECGAPCLGYSFKRGEEVSTLIKENFPPTFWLAIGAFILWMVIGVFTGIYAALRRSKWQDKAVSGIALVGYALPTFFVGLVFLFFIVLKWGLLPYPSYVSPFVNLTQFLQTMILPWITLAIVSAAFYVRLTRTQMLETLGSDFIRTARAKGVKERVVLMRHALRAGLTPIVTAAGLDLAGLLGGAIITEAVFTLPGLGSLAISSVNDADLPVVVGITLVAAFFIVMANLIVDLLYPVIDPRVRLT
ncbi:MAG: ABC transporter permease [Actinobacteria bacterium]|nr:ABC transporter permease [Actinomycetota bacterium]